MKNFNLISPSDNGFEYTVRFQDPIKIMPNSRVDFKFAELVRAGEVVFNEAQTITLNAEPTDCLPQYDLKNPVAAAPNAKPLFTGALPSGVASNTTVLSIPAGVYSYEDFRTTLQNTLTNGLKPSAANNRVINFQGFAVQSDTDSGNTTDIAFGLEYNFSSKNADVDPDEIELDSGGEYQMNVQVDDGSHYAGDSITKTSGGTNDRLDAGAIINIDYCYNHRYFKNSNSPPTTHFENSIYIEGLDTTQDQIGDIHFGFYHTATSKVLGEGTNRLFANGSAGTNAIQVDGSAGTTAENSFLPVPLGIKVSPYGDTIEIYSGFSSGGAGIQNADNAFYDIDRITLLESVPVHNYFDESETPKFLVQLYQTRKTIPYSNRTEGVDERDTYFRVYALNHKESTSVESYNMTEIYDSAIHGEFLTHKFEVGTGVAYGADPNASEKAESQLPYQAVVGMTQQGEGWKKIKYPKVGIVSTDEQGEEQYLLLNYKMTFSDDLARALNIPVKNKASALDLAPNFLHDKSIFSNAAALHNNANLFHNSNIANPWKRDSYSIFIDLPCNNYKNVSDKLNGGFRKSVIANIPSPFSSADIVAAGNTNNEMVATYEPYQQVSSELKNNEISINSFKISILDMKTEQLAKQLSASVVNFSIHCPEGSSCS